MVDDLYATLSDGTRTNVWIMAELLGRDDVDDGAYAHVVGGRALGDYEGHPFRGNQWTSGTGEVDSPSSAVEAISAGRPANIEAGSARDLVLTAAKRGGKPDMMNVHVDGEPMFVRGLGLSRSEMPQVPGDNTDAFVERLKADGITLTREDVPARSLKPIQREINAAKVGGMLKAYRGGREMRPILVSKDNYVLDGHHRWGVKVVEAIDRPGDRVTMPVQRMSLNHREAIALMREFNEKHGIAARHMAEGARELGGQGSGNYGHAGRPGETGGSAAGGPRSVTAQRALKHFKPADVRAQRHAEANELKIRQMIGGMRTDDNLPVDVITTIGGQKHGVEVKTLIINTNDKITMRADALERKAEWAKDNDAIVHTVVIDDREKFLSAHYSGHQFYYRRGSGSFRLGGMVKVASAAHLKRLVTGEVSE